MLREGFLLSLNSEKPSPMGVIWTDEIDRARWLSERGVDAPSYMIDTIRRLRTLVGQSITLRLLIGADQAIQFDRWRDHRALARLAEPLVMLRPPHASPAALLDELASRGMRAPQLVAWARRIVPEVAWDTSATRVRELLPLQPLDHDLWDDRIHLSVDAAVAQYIITHRLYAVGSKWKPPRASARTAKARRPKPARE
jgi:nicotinic acid mononucleotide adenylyltransferase